MATGAEILLKSMGLGDAMAGVKALIDSGALQRIVKFSDEVEAMRATLARIEGRLNGGIETCSHCGRDINRDGGNHTRMLEAPRAD